MNRPAWMYINATEEEPQKPQIDLPVVIATINLKPWKGKVNALCFVHDPSFGKSITEDAIDVLKRKAEKEKGWKRRTACSVSVDYPLNIKL